MSSSRRSSLSIIDKQAIWRYRRNNPDVSVSGMTTWVHEELGVSASNYTVRRFLKKADIAWVSGLQVLNNVIDEYVTYIEERGSNDPLQHHEEVDTNDLTELYTNGTDNITNQGGANETSQEGMAASGLSNVSSRDAQKYLQGWITYLEQGGVERSEELLHIAKKHAEALERGIENTKRQPIITEFFRKI